MSDPVYLSPEHGLLSTNYVVETHPEYREDLCAGYILLVPCDLGMGTGMTWMHLWLVDDGERS